MTTSKTTLALRAIRPHNRIVTPHVGPNRADRRRTQAKHTRQALMPDGTFVVVRMTSRMPWTKRARRRRAAKLARAARKANR